MLIKILITIRVVNCLHHLQEEEEKEKNAETGNRTQASAATKRGTAIILSRRHLCAEGGTAPGLDKTCNSARPVVRPATRCLGTATLAKRLMRLPRKQKVVSSNLTGGSFCPIFVVFFVQP